MVQYCVSFFNNLVNSNGIPRKCLQRAVMVSGAKDAEAALERAKREFELLENIPNWNCHAQFLETETVKIAAKAKRSGGRSRTQAPLGSYRHTRSNRRFSRRVS